MKKKTESLPEAFVGKSKSSPSSKQSITAAPEKLKTPAHKAGGVKATKPRSVHETTARAARSGKAGGTQKSAASAGDTPAAENRQAKAPSKKDTDPRLLMYTEPKAAAAVGSRVFLNIGSGEENIRNLPKAFLGPEWRHVRVDCNPDNQPDILASMVNMDIVPTNWADVVWSHHSIEHIYAHEVELAFKEFFRVLKPGGLLVVITPDLQKVAEFVAMGRLDEPLYVSPAGPIAAIDILYGFRAAVARGNTLMAHKTGFVSQTMIAALQKAGFALIRSSRDNLEIIANAIKL